MKYPITVSKSNSHKAALSIVNCFLKLTDKELDLIVGMLNQDTKVLNTSNRKKLRDSLGTSVFTFNNYIKRLRDRGYLLEVAGSLELHPKLIAAANDKEIVISITCQ